MPHRPPHPPPIYPPLFTQSAILELSKNLPQKPGTFKYVACRISYEILAISLAGLYCTIREPQYFGYFFI